jgi:hypothetical protein
MIEYCRIVAYFFYGRAVTGNYKLVSVVLPTSLVAISDHAFERCTALSTITIPT